MPATCKAHFREPCYDRKIDDLTYFWALLDSGDERIDEVVLLEVWSLTKVLATILFVMALPALILCFIFAGGLLLLIPIGLLGLAFALLST